MEPESQINQKLFDEPVDLYDFHPIHPQDTPAQSTDFYLTTSQASRSVPGSRRHSIDRNALLDAKLKNDRADLSSPFSVVNDSVGVFPKSSHVSKAIDVDTVQHTNHNKHPSSIEEPSPAFSVLDTPISASIKSELLNQQGLLNEDSHPSGFTPPFQTTPSQLPKNTSYFDQFAGSTDNLSSFMYNGDYVRLFSSSSTLDLPSSVRKNSVRNKSFESLRSKSWAQHLENPNGPLFNHGPADDSLPNARAQAAFYGPTRRYSYGWPTVKDVRDDGFGHLAADARMKNRLTASQSYSDLHAVASRQCSNGTSFGTYNTFADSGRDLPLISCQQYQQFGFCPRDDQCPYAHASIPLMSGIPSPSLLHPKQTNTSTTGQMGLPVQNIPFNAATLCQQYTFGPLLNQSSKPPMSYFLKTAQVLNACITSPAATYHSRSSSPMTRQEGSDALQQRRSLSDQESTRFAGAKLEDYLGKLYELCKDQNGCRFLQKKIEEQNGLYLQTIFDEIHPHLVELMTGRLLVLTKTSLKETVDPFGNYLCQKLLERCDDSQRSAIVDIVSPELLMISLNMHGTRAVQKLIEFLSTTEQIQTVTVALNPNVVELIKDLNGNHVIQKCLHRLSPEHNQFVYDVVCANCVTVATHRHGCCVLQRCIDNASDSQRAQLVNEITRSALPLVQDPFGNYVVQYVLDLGDVLFSDALIQRFFGHTCSLSVQKFSSNVIEKCIRVAEPQTRRSLITELIDPNAMEKLLHDSFANYVVQTSLDYADSDQRVQVRFRIE
ncbi:hypothetical protein DFQ28_011143 [Apophysomyces sp. BC1034]|nr:hypothetical protein DFQ29_002496 [Apophysomyces sp. BC1021]KAG0184433.1 hypothetical protein DFQ28_011143 [Apophysomyces sp. BC1034]